MLNAVTLTAVHLVARFAHLLVYLGIGNFFGANASTDAVLLLQAPLLVIMAVTAGAADTVIMPVMHRAVGQGCTEGLPRILWLRALKWVSPVTLLTLAVAFFWLADSQWQVALLLLPLPLLSTSSALFVGILNSQGRYHLAATGPLFGALLAAPIFAFPPTSSTLAMVLLSLELGRFIGLGGFVCDRFSAHPETDARTALISWAVQGARWQAFGSLCAAFNVLVNTLVASQLGTGVVTQIEYASRLWNMVPLLFTGPLTLIHANISRQAALGGLRTPWIHGLALSFFSVSATVGAIFFIAAPWIVDLLYGAGKMESHMVRSLGEILGIYFFCAIPMIPGLVYVKALGSQGRSNVIGIAAAITVPINIIFNLIFVSWFSERGIPMAAIGALTINTVLLSLWTSRENRL